MLLNVLSGCKQSWTLYAIDSTTQELVNQRNERISCGDVKAEEYYCLSGDDFADIVRYCGRARQEKSGDITRP
jgi:hypothetical protein